MARVYFSGEEDLSFRRYSSRGSNYPPGHEQSIYAGTNNGLRNYYLSSHNNGNNDRGSEQESNGESRRRIPVAVCPQSLCLPIRS
jgi:hypothetical protein